MFHDLFETMHIYVSFNHFEISSRTTDFFFFSRERACVTWCNGQRVNCHLKVSTVIPVICKITYLHNYFANTQYVHINLTVHSSNLQVNLVVCLNHPEVKSRMKNLAVEETPSHFNLIIRARSMFVHNGRVSRKYVSDLTATKY